jgi:hypothetical protein
MLTGKMVLAHERNQSGGYHSSSHRSPVSCSDTLDSPLKDVSLPRPFGLIVRESARETRDERTHAATDHRGQRFLQRELPSIERRVFGEQNAVRRCALGTE